jgi:hypothetical protein
MQAGCLHHNLMDIIPDSFWKENNAMRRPNILLIHTDQQRWDALGANGNPDIKTPHLD